MPETQTTAERSLGELHRKLHTREPYIEDPNLRRQVIDFLRRADSVESDLLEHIEAGLSELRRYEDENGHQRQYEMRRPADAGRDEGAAFFPDACEGCPHYGTRCPIFNSPTVMQTRDRLQDDLADANDAEVRHKYGRIATQHDCHQITALLSEREAATDVAQDGWDLYRRVLQQTDVLPLDEADAASERVDDAEPVDSGTPTAGGGS